MRARTYTHGRPRYDAHTGARGAPYQHAKLDFMCEIECRADGIHTQIAIELHARESPGKMPRRKVAAPSRLDAEIDVFDTCYEILTTSILHCVKNFEPNNEFRRKISLSEHRDII